MKQWFHRKRDAMDAIALRLCVHFAPSGFTMITR